MSFKEELGARVKEARKYHGFTVKELAEKAGISASYLYKIERGQASPLITVIIELVTSLEVTASFLLYGGDSAANVIVFQKILKIIHQLPKEKQKIAIEKIKQADKEYRDSIITSRESYS